MNEKFDFVLVYARVIISIIQLMKMGKVNFMRL